MNRGVSTEPAHDKHPSKYDNSKSVKVINIVVMEKLPQQCRENATFFRKHDYMSLDVKSNGTNISFRFNKIPDFYVIDDKKYFAAEIKVEGLKISTATLAADDVLNIKMHELEEFRQVRNFNFLIPSEANARQVSVEVFDGNNILIRAPLRK